MLCKNSQILMYISKTGKLIFTLIFENSYRASFIMTIMNTLT